MSDKYIELDRVLDEESWDFLNDNYPPLALSVGQMTYEELKANYTVAYKIIMRERAMRDKVFAENQEKRQEKMAEMDKLLEIVDDLKDELKKHIGNGPEQPTLLDVVQKAVYP